MIFNNKDKKEQLQKELDQKQAELQQIKDEELKAKKAKQRAERQKRIKRKEQARKEKLFALNQPPSQRLLKLILDLSQATMPTQWYKKHVKENDSYNLADIFAKIDSLEQKDGKN